MWLNYIHVYCSKKVEEEIAGDQRSSSDCFTTSISFGLYFIQVFHPQNAITHSSSPYSQLYVGIQKHAFSPLSLVFPLFLHFIAGMALSAGKIYRKKFGTTKELCSSDFQYRNVYSTLNNSPQCCWLCEIRDFREVSYGCHCGWAYGFCT